MLFVLFAFIVAADIALAVPKPANFDALKARYLKLRNTDAEVSKPADWQAVAEDLYDFAQSARKSPQAPAALFDASIAFEKVGEAASDSKQFQRSIGVLSELVEHYPQDVLADDALLRIGDLYSRGYAEEEKARGYYRRVIQAYPSGDAVEIARARLKKSGPSSKEALPSGATEDGSLPLVVIDPGHGGEDFGAQGVGGILEKDVVLDVAFELAKKLKEQHTARVRLSRKTDDLVPLSERSAFANDSEADLFISLHSNASPGGKLSGLQTFYLDTGGDEASRLLAERENGSETQQGAQADLQFMLSDLVQNAKVDDSIRLAQTIQRALVDELHAASYGVKDLGARKAPFYVLVGAHMPCVLVELLFIDNPGDGKLLSDKAFRKKVAQGLYQGIALYLRAAKKGTR